MFSFLWDGKPHKVSKIQITNDYIHRGLKMINLENFIAAQKIVWIKRLFTSSDTPWALLASSLFNTHQLYKFGPLWSKRMSESISNPFWKEVIFAWFKFSNQFSVCESDILNMPLWYNSSISATPLYFPHWDKMGVNTPLDLIKADGSILTMREVTQLYGIRTNFLEYLRIHRCVKLFLNKINLRNFYYTRPIFPVYLKILMKKTNGSKYFYANSIKQYENSKLKAKWNGELDITLDSDDWKKIYRICFKLIKRNDLIWFQYRILQRILGTKAYLFKINKSQDSYCSFCETSIETLTHLFVSCPMVSEFWQNLTLSLQQLQGIFLTPEPSSILLGIVETEFDFFPKNIIILVAKKYIWTCSRHQKPLTLQGFKMFLKNIYIEEDYIAKITNQSDKFETSWFLLKEISES